MSVVPGQIYLSYGGVTLYVDSFGGAAKPEIDPKKGRTGTVVSCTAKLYALAATPSELAARVAAAASALSVSGGDLVVATAEGAVLWAMPAAGGNAAGPHVGFTVSTDPTTPLRANFDLSAEIDRLEQDDDPASPNKPKNSSSLSVQYRPDGLLTITRSGVLNGVSTGDYFTNTLLPQWQQQYPAASFKTTESYETATEGADAKLTYQLQAVQRSVPLPAPPDGIEVVDGEHTLTTDRDEQQRLTKTIGYELLVKGSAVQGLIDRLRPSDVVILRENVQVTHIAEQRLRVSFVTLESADGNFLLNWTNRITVQQPEHEDDVYDVRTYPGQDPLLVLKPKGVRQIVQEGSAVGQEYFLRASSPAYPDALLAPREVTYEDLNDAEKRTSWRYVMRLPAKSEFDPRALSRKNSDPAYWGNPPIKGRSN